MLGDSAKLVLAKAITITIHMDKLKKSTIKQIQDHAQLMLNVCMETVIFLNLACSAWGFC